VNFVILFGIFTLSTSSEKKTGGNISSSSYRHL